MTTISEFLAIILAIISISNCSVLQEIVPVNGHDQQTVNNDLQFDWSTCGESKGCFRSPSGCDPQNCDVLISWEDREDIVHFELSKVIGTTPSEAHWIAVGFSHTTLMHNASVISCIHRNDENFKVESSYNPGYRNDVLQNSVLGIVNGSYRGQVSDGRSECEFSRVKEVSPDDPDAQKVYNLSSPLEYHYLLAHGPLSDTDTKWKHVESPIVTFTKIDVEIYEDIDDIKLDWDTCGLTKGCFRSPTGCSPQDCSVLFSWQEGEDTVHFEMSRALGSTPSEEHWIALGVSQDTSMGDTSLTSCIHRSDGSFYVESSFNEPRSNSPLENDTLGIEENSYRGWIIDGRSECEFNRFQAVSPDHPESHLVYNLTSPLRYYYLLAHGEINDLGCKTKHPESPIVTSTQINIGIYENIGNQISTTASPNSTVAPPEFEFNWNDCGVTKGCYRSPAFCEPLDCNIMVSWEEREENVHFELSQVLGSAPSDAHWIAVGFSPDMSMGGTSVVSCIHSGNGAFRMESSYNPSTFNTPLSDDNHGIVEDSYRGQVRDGKSECEFSRVKAVPPEESQAEYVFNLTSPLQYHYLFAYGQVTESGGKRQHTESPTVTSTKIDAGIYENIGGTVFTWNDCGVTKGCFRSPSGCDPRDCDVLISWEDRDDTVHFELSTFIVTTSSQSHWAALGISDAPNMFNASVIACLHSGDGEVRPESSFNNDSFSNAVLDNDTLGIIEDSFQGLVSNGRSECEFSRVKAVSPENPEASFVFNISSPLEYHYLLAHGELSDTGSKRKHVETPVVTLTKIDVGVYENIGRDPDDQNSTAAPPDFEFNWNDCGLTKGCFRSPAECDPDDCDFLVSWEEGENDVHFELSARLGSTPSNSHWMAVGFSNIPNMDDASVVSCVHSSDGRTQAESSYNPGKSNAPLTNPALGIIDESYQGRVRSGRSECEFKRVKALPRGTPQEQFVFNISAPLEYHYLLGHGPLSPSGQKQKHQVSPIVTPTKISIGKNDNIGGAFIQPQIQAHATLMLAAWTLFSGIGILNARYFKKAWQSIEVAGLKLWFVIHRVCMSLVLGLTTAGFVIIFVHVNGFSDVKSVTPSVIRSHPILGIIVMACVFINPIMAMLRPNPDAAKRPVFNWAHRIVGEGGRLCAVFNLMTGLSLPASQAMVEDWMFWAMIGAICFHIVIEIILLISHFTREKQMHRIESIARDVNGYGDPVSKPNAPSFTLQTVLLVTYGICVASLTLAILIRIAIA